MSEGAEALSAYKKTKLKNEKSKLSQHVKAHREVRGTSGCLSLSVSVAATAQL